MFINFSAAETVHGIRNNSPKVLKFGFGIQVQKNRPRSANVSKNSLRIKFSYPFAGLPSFFQNFFRVAVTQANFFALPNVAGHIQPSFFVVNSGNTRHINSAAIHDERKIENVHHQKFIRLDVQIFFVNLNRRKVINFCDTVNAQSFGDCHFLTDRFPTEIIFGLNVQIFSAVSRNDNSVMMIFVAHDVTDKSVFDNRTRCRMIFAIQIRRLDNAGLRAEKRNVIQFGSHRFHKNGEVLFEFRGKNFNALEVGNFFQPTVQIRTHFVEVVNGVAIDFKQSHFGAVEVTATYDTKIFQQTG